MSQFPNDTGWDAQGNVPEAYPHPQPQAQAQAHSGLGIASFIIALLAGLIILALIVTAGVMEASGGVDEESPEAMAVGCGIILALLFHLVGLGLGIGSLFQARNKLFGILGLVLNAVALLGVVALMVIGLAFS